MEKICKNKYLCEYTNFFDLYNNLCEENYIGNNDLRIWQIIEIVEHNILGDIGLPEIYPWYGINLMKPVCDEIKRISDMPAGIDKRSVFINGGYGFRESWNKCKSVLF